MTVKYLIFVLCYHALLGEIGAERTMGPLGNIIIDAIYLCRDDENPKGDEIKLNLWIVEENGEKALNFVLENKIPIDNQLNYTLELKKFENGGWKMFYNLKGDPCKDLNLIKNLWKKLTDKLEPKHEKPCPILPGTYKLNNFKASTQDFDIKNVFYGNLLIKVTAVNKDKKRVFCVMGEGTSQTLLKK